MLDDPIDLEAFHAGDRGVLAEVYRRHVAGVERAVSCFCRGAAAECVVHDVFLQLLERPGVRAQFSGGDLGAWLATMARRRAIDHLRRQRRFTLLDDPRSLEGKLPPVDDEESLLHRDQVRQLSLALRRFSEEELPALAPGLREVFRLRVEGQVSQAEAARTLKLPRPTLIDREQRLMKRLGRFLRRHLGGRP